MNKSVSKKLMVFLGVAILIAATQLAVIKYEKIQSSKPTTSITK
jgi:hypothetical protein